MNFTVAKCPSCGANVQVDQNLEHAFCSYCGSKIIVQDAVQKIKIVGPVEMTGTVKTQNHEFEAKFANANNWARIYFDRGPNAVSYGAQKGYDAVVQYYTDAELVGANESKYYVEFSKFYVRANIEGFKTGYRKLLDRQAFINHYIFLLDTAISYADDSVKDSLRQEKEDTVKMLNTELQKFKEHKKGCYIATCVYGSYDCPEVWMLRRFRDNTLAETWAGRVFIRAYYAVSPTLVKWFGETKWFKLIWGKFLNKMVSKLRSNGVESTPYNDKMW